MCTPKIYISSLKHYNSGELVGRWLDVTSELQTQVHDYIKSINCEEWAIHDYEGFGELYISEFESLDHLIDLAEAIGEHGEIITHVISHFCCGLDYAVEQLEENYQGAFDSVSDFVYQYIDDIGLLSDASDIIRNYFDYESFQRDLELNSELVSFQIDNEYHVFLQ